MLALWFLLASVFFAALAFDARQFEASSRFRSVVPIERMGRAVGVDPLSTLEQDRAQTNQYTAVGGVPGLFWVFVVLAAGSLAAAAWSTF